MRFFPLTGRVRTALVAGLLVVSSVALACEGGSSKSWAGEGKRRGKSGKGGGPRGQRGGPGGPGGQEEQEIVTVETVAISPARIERRYKTSGTLKALRSAALVAVQPGIIKELTVEEADTVEKDQVLAKLDGRELALQASRADLEVRNLEQELERLEQVAARNAVAREELDKQRYAVQEARAAAKLSRHQARQTVVRAPFSGTITKRYVDIGNLATTATVLFDVADLSALELELYLPEKEATHVKLDSAVDVELLDGTTFVAHVIRRAPIVDPLTGTVKFTVRTEAPPAGALPGAFVRARVLVDVRESAPSLPTSAIFEVEGSPHVYVVREGKARRIPVQLGLEGETRTEIVGGLGPEDQVVTQGDHDITEGMPLATASTDAGGGTPTQVEARSGS
jgi:membrane fusion protein (multidrug efflux system)